MENQGRQEKILAVHSGALGDCVLFGHLLRRLAGQVTLVAGGQKARLLEGMGVVRWAKDFDALGMHEIFSDLPLEACRLPELVGAHDRLISCFGCGDRRAELRLAAVCRAVTAGFLPVRPPDDGNSHLMDVWTDVLGLSAALPSGPAAWPVPKLWRRQAATALFELKISQHGYVVIHPGAGSQAKCWPLENYLRLADRLEQVIFVTGPVEADRWPPGRTDRIGERFAVLACPPPEALAGVLAGASAYVGNDSGPTHLAAAVGTVTLALFGPTRPEHFAPLGPAVKIIRSEPIENIPVEQVAEVLPGLRR